MWKISSTEFPKISKISKLYEKKIFFKNFQKFFGGEKVGKSCSPLGKKVSFDHSEKFRISTEKIFSRDHVVFDLLPGHNWQHNLNIINLNLISFILIYISYKLG